MTKNILLQKVSLSSKKTMFLKNQIKVLFDLSKYLIKKYVYTINHKRIAINYCKLLIYINSNKMG